MTWSTAVYDATGHIKAGGVAGALLGAVGVSVRIEMYGPTSAFTTGGVVRVAGRITGVTAGSGIAKKLLGGLIKGDYSFGPDYIELGAPKADHLLNATYEVSAGPIDLPIPVVIAGDYLKLTSEIAYTGDLPKLDDITGLLPFDHPEQPTTAAITLGVTVAATRVQLNDAAPPPINHVPVPTPGPSPSPSGGDLIPDDQNMRALFLTEFLCYKDFGSDGRHAVLEHGRKAYTHIYSLADLQRNGDKGTRTYVEWARDRGKVLPLLTSQAKYAKSLGYRLVVCGLNAWGARHGYGAQCGGIQRTLRSESDLYTDEQLEIEKTFFAALWTLLGGDLAGYMPLLEAEAPEAAEFERKLVVWIRQAGYKGVVLTNHIGTNRNNKMNLVKTAGAWTAGSINHANEWGGYQVHNSDGMTELNSGNHGLIRQLTANPGDHGFLIWSKELAGNHTGSNVPCQLRQEYVDHAHVPANWPREGGHTPAPTPAPNPGNGDWQGRNLKQGFLWKPVSESTHKLVVLFPNSLRDSYRREGAGIFRGFPGTASNRIEGGQFANDTHNDERIHFRFNHAGSHYPHGCWVVIMMQDGTQVGYQLGDTSKRNEHVQPSLSAGTSSTHLRHVPNLADALVSWPPPGERVYRPSAIRYTALTSNPPDGPGGDPAPLPLPLPNPKIPNRNIPDLTELEPVMDFAAADGFVYDPLGRGITLPRMFVESTDAIVYIDGSVAARHNPRTQGPRIPFQVWVGEGSEAHVAVRLGDHVYWFHVSDAYRPAINIGPLRD